MQGALRCQRAPVVVHQVVDRDLDRGIPLLDGQPALLIGHAPGQVLRVEHRRCGRHRGRGVATAQAHGHHRGQPGDAGDDGNPNEDEDHCLHVLHGPRGV